MKPIDLWQEMIQPEHEFRLQLYLHNLIARDWDKERFVHECKRYLESNSNKVKYVREGRSNVVPLPGSKRRLARRDFRDSGGVIY